MPDTYAESRNAHCGLRALIVLVLGFALVALGAPASPVAAQEGEDSDSARIAELERRLDAVTREIESLRLGADVVEADTTIGGFGYGASKVYQISQGVSVGGYGEVLYENYAGELEDGTESDRADRFDALRAIIYLGYKFNDRLLFNSEIEIEHADESFLEFAYLDYLLTDNVGIRGGLLLAPIGFLNELHEPPIFLGTERPVTENRIIPSTWRENGVGLFGSTDRFDWRVYLMNSFDGSGFGPAGLRGGRQKGSQALANDLGVAARFDYTGTPGLILGASTYIGETAQNAETTAGEEVGGRLFLWDLHADYRVKGLWLRGLVSMATLDEVEEMNQVNGLSPSTGGIGEEMIGWYFEAGYDVLHNTRRTDQLIPYLRHERVNTQSQVADGFTANPANELTVTSIGVAWRPVTQAVAKIGYQLRTNEAETGQNQLNFQLGWLF